MNMGLSQWLLSATIRIRLDNWTVCEVDASASPSVNEFYEELLLRINTLDLIFLEFHKDSVLIINWQGHAKASTVGLHHLFHPGLWSA